MTLNIAKYKDSDHAGLVDLWERSVRATHHFLKPGAIESLKVLVKGIDFHSFDVYCAFTEENKMAGILGVYETKLEMLFLSPEYMGKGVGRQLMEFCLDKLHVNMVDVNEDNDHAIGFYKKFGFKVYDRTEVDDHGNPYPILKMKL